jgi:hypothetical protein
MALVTLAPTRFPLAFCTPHTAVLGITLLVSEPIVLVLMVVLLLLLLLMLLPIASASARLSRRIY